MEENDKPRKCEKLMLDVIYIWNFLRNGHDSRFVNNISREKCDTVYQYKLYIRLNDIEKDQKFGVRLWKIKYL